jgi:TetR/AcrR family transcriptional regulator, transcriptional repressor for nem operon
MTPRKASSTRDRIVEAAVSLFYEHGYAATGMADILKKAKANSGSFYFFFKSKHELLSAVLAWYERMLQPILIAPVCQQEQDPVERVFALLGLYRRNILATEFAFGCPIGRLALEIDPLDRAHRDIARNFEGWAGAVRAFLDAAGERLPRRVNRAQLSRLVLSVMEGGVMQSRSQRSIKPFDDSVAQLREYFRLLEAETKTKPRRTTKSTKTKYKEKSHA